MSPTSLYGANIAFIEDLYEQFRLDPESVSPSWREFFTDYEPTPDEDEEMEAVGVPPPAVVETVTRAAVPVAATPAATPRPEAPAQGASPDPSVTILRGVASKIVSNMEASLSVPTATSLRSIPVKVLEENRRIMNHHLLLMGQSKASFTHVIAWAIVKALGEQPRMNSAFAMQDGQPARVDHPWTHLGIAVDVEKKDGSHSLVVPNIKSVETLDFAQFLKAYSDVIRKARTGALVISDFEGTTISLTNPGTIGTVSSTPRLMQTQGTIIATGQIGYPAEYSGTDPEVLADFGISKTMAITSTYDHRVIQGAESGAFLARVHELLIGSNEFYDEIFRDLRIPYEPVYWSVDRNRSLLSGSSVADMVQKEAMVIQLINAYRVRGHLLANLDPLEYKVGRHPELNPAYYGLTIWDLDRDFGCGGLAGKTTARLREILDTLRGTYCGKLGPEYMHIQEPVQKRWLQDRMEPKFNSEPLEPSIKRRILMKLTDADVFERFLHTKYVGNKRFSLEGAESTIPMLDRLLDLAVTDGVREVVIGMAHRGRLNVLANVMGKSYRKIFNEFEGDIDPNTTQGSGDVKYHLGAEGTYKATDGSELKLTLASNPSHLEAVDPIVEGLARAKQQLAGDVEHREVVPVLIHGDAAFAGQGVVAETLNLSQLHGYRTGGTVHLVVNNQIGFTTGPEAARSSVYATDIAKMVQAPIFHVNGDDPEACIRAVNLAFAFRQQFHKDVVIDLVCYRRHGHNEGDDPSLTQPRMYKLIRDHRSVRKLYTEALLRKGDLEPDEAETWLGSFQEKLQEAFDATKAAPPAAVSTATQQDPLWTDEPLTGYQNEPSVETGPGAESIQKAGAAVLNLPEGFALHPKLRSLWTKRSAMLDGTTKIDWAFAEALAFGTIVLDGHRVRLSGQDSGRGTFSQRHSAVFDSVTGLRWIPIDSLSGERAPHEIRRLVHPQIRNALETVAADVDTSLVGFQVFDSHLSEYAVLGFEYGYSVADPNALVLWEAQFGDFINGAQIIIDQFISSAEEKWGQHSGLVLLLPHGHEGQGPEHSSARLERFLTLCAEGNMQVVNVTTPAQYFHVLRRQMRNDPRKPLVVVTPKSLLRHPEAVSTRDQLEGGRFEVVIDDPAFESSTVESRSGVTRIVLTAGKVYYDLDAARRSNDERRVAIVRLEQIYPWPQTALSEAFDRYPEATEVVWVQEEPRNMGAWDFVDEKIAPLLTATQRLRYVGRPFSASPATGSHHRHEAQQQALVASALTW